MLIFGSYLDKSRSLTGEAVSITILDTFVALTAGFIIIPACFSYGIQPDAGPSLIFITLPNIFAKMSGGTVFVGKPAFGVNRQNIRQLVLFAQFVHTQNRDNILQSLIRLQCSLLLSRRQMGRNRSLL